MAHVIELFQCSGFMLLIVGPKMLTRSCDMQLQYHIFTEVTITIERLVHANRESIILGDFNAHEGVEELLGWSGISF